ncbi:growth arrest and DNA damage-inducible protein GADD45 alpha-like [Liolophura sinensis]|uniref:growth arrest and DNA damage-inducible protein GADD45 alpha-like n=1 Tax=Liolophura sinensis TaxID=3198878 RepID=UPI003159466B
MTFPDTEDVVQSCFEMGKPDVSVNSALRTTLNQARAEGRMTQGAYECAKLLELDPDGVMLCLLPVVTNPQDVTVVIQHTLMEAFCWEHDIPLLKVSSPKNMVELFPEEASGADKSSLTSRAINCVLIQSPQNGLSGADKAVCAFYNKALSSNVLSWPVINLQI